MIDLVIDGTRALAPRIAEFTLRACSGGLLPTFAAGAYIEIETGAGWRAYSLLDVPPSPWMYRIAVELQPEGSGGSVWMHRRSPGDRLVAREPAIVMARRTFRIKVLQSSSGAAARPARRFQS